MPTDSKQLFHNIAKSEFEQQPQGLTAEANRLCGLARDGSWKDLENLINRDNCDTRSNQSSHLPYITVLISAVLCSDANAARKVRLVLKQGASVDKRDGDGWSALHWAAFTVKVEIVQILIEFKADVNALNHCDNTPLILAINYRQSSDPEQVMLVAKHLMLHGADPFIRNDCKQNAVTLAKELGMTEVYKLLTLSSQELQLQQLNDNHHHHQQHQQQQQPQEPEPFEDADSFYEVTSPQGICAVININNYDDHCGYHDRKGSEHDVTRVKEVFSKLGFTVDVKEDLTASEIENYLCKIKLDYNRSYGAFVCFLMAHGTNGAIYGRDGREQKLEDLAKLFNSTNCPPLAGKPKIFFVQACRTPSEYSQLAKVQHDGEVTQISLLPLFAPPEADSLFCYSSPKGAYAWRVPEKGSPFVQTICDVIAEKSDSMHLQDMITTANRRLFQQPLLNDSNTKHLYTVIETKGTLTRYMKLTTGSLPKLRKATETRDKPIPKDDNSSSTCQVL